MKFFEKQSTKVNKRKPMDMRTRILIGVGSISATGIASIILFTKKILTPKSQKIIASTISKDSKNAIHTIADKLEEVKSILTEGYNNIHSNLQKVTKKISKELD
jgi:chemotaxis protein CheY-P-specific phosphatase CheC